jgi:hypothetical protein
MRPTTHRYFTVSPRTLCLAVSLAAAAASANPLFAQFELDTARAGRFDNGKMWTFEYAPSEYFTETYGFDANDAWFERARLAALRIPGCSASFVSPHGLLATNHHCVRGVVARVTREGEGLLDDGFYATSLEEERRIPGYRADQLIAIEDVSNEVFAALDRATSDAERDQARSQVIERITDRARQRHADLGDSVIVQVIGLYNGGRYSAYVFRRFTDIRLVAAAELQMGFFGGDPDNFTYPRYALDFAFLRVYDRAGEPFQTDHYFGWSEEGVEEDDVVFVIGNPGPTNRLATVAQLEYQRDVQVPAAVHFLSSRLDALGDFRAAHPERAEALGFRNRMFGLSNSLKASTGRLQALNTPVIVAKRRDAERLLREGIQSRAELRGRYGDVFDRITEIQRQKRSLGAQYAAFFALQSTFSSATLRRGMEALAYLAARESGATTVSGLRRTLLGISDHPAELEHRLLAERFMDLERHLGADHPVTVTALNGRSPWDAAQVLIANSVLGSAEGTAHAVESDALGMSDPALRLAAALQPVFGKYQAEAGRLSAQERELAAELGRARFDVYGASVPPDASRSPRITDGVVKPYEYNGTLAPAYTTFYGLYDRARSHGSGGDWELPTRWQMPPQGLDLATPLNFVSTADTYGGNSGSPAVTPELELVGLNFDRNIQGLSRDFIYLPEQGRNIMVDVRAIQAAMDHVYDADRIVLELTTQQLYQTEEEADATRR